MKVKLQHVLKLWLLAIVCFSVGLATQIEAKVIGSDDRTQVADTRVSPYSRIVVVRTVNSNGTFVNWGTGFLIDEQTVLTNAHVVKPFVDGSRQVQVVPGRAGSGSPFGVANVSQITISPDYIAQGGLDETGTSQVYQQYDLAVLHLASSIGTKAGWFELQAYDDYTQLPVTITGYPGKNGGTNPLQDLKHQWTGSGNLEILNPGSLYINYQIDTNSGNSGSPIYDQNDRVIGINTGSDEVNHNFGILLTGKNGEFIKQETGHVPLAPPTSGVFGTVRWVWHTETKTLEFIGDGEFPNGQTVATAIATKINEPIQKIVITGKVTAAPNSSGLFANLQDLQSITGLAQLATNHVTNMSSLFEKDFKLSEISGLTNWDVSNVEDMTSTFRNIAATSLDLNNWNFSKVKSMSAMFKGASLKQLDMRNWQTKALTNTSDMFANSALVTITGNFDTSHVVNMDNMFRDMQLLEAVDVSNWNLSSVQSMKKLFYTDRRLKTLNVSKWQLGKLQYMNDMFYDCPTLTGLDVANWDVSSVIDMTRAFYATTKLTGLNVTNWQTSSLQYMTNVFKDCGSVNTVDMSHWDLSHLVQQAA